MEQLINLIKTNWDQILYILGGLGLTGVGGRKGYVEWKKRQKRKDENQDAKINHLRHELDKLKREMEGIMSKLDSHIGNDAILLSAIEELKHKIDDFRERYWQDRVKDKEETLKYFQDKSNRK